MAHTYSATMSRDEDAGVWYISDTDFPGLVAEARSQRELLRKVRERVPELYELSRHLFEPEPLASIPLRYT